VCPRGVHERASYADAGSAHREAFGRAVRVADRLKPRDWRALGAYFALISSYSRTRDRIFVAQIAAMAGMSRQRTSESLRRLWSSPALVDRF
jgi:hypothetical protein